MIYRSPSATTPPATAWRRPIGAATPPPSPTTASGAGAVETSVTEEAANLADTTAEQAAKNGEEVAKQRTVQGVHTAESPTGEGVAAGATE